MGVAKALWISHDGCVPVGPAPVPYRVGWTPFNPGGPMGADMNDAILDGRGGRPDPPGRDSAPAAARPADPLAAATGLVGSSPAMRALRESISRYAKTTASVVVLGETGTGKELVARAIHEGSPRSARPFVAANVAALGAGTLPSELFGHERGAFTGAHAARRGLFEQAHSGTLFLDEAGELAPEAQASLLRVLESGEFRPVGAERARRADVRLVVATHRDLGAMVAKELFRADLYFRLNTLVLRVPPLRHRIWDVRELAPHLLARMRPEAGERGIDEAAVRALADYGWPGNVRQLANVLRRAVAESPCGVLTARDVRESLRAEPPARREILDGAHASFVQDVLASEGGSIAASARRLGVARSTLRAFIKRFHVVHVRSG